MFNILKRGSKILAVVKFNDGEAFVLEKTPDLKYTKYDNKTIVGTDGCFLDCYYYERPIKPINPNWSGWQAFGGRKFDLELTDGTVEHCYGQWWSGVSEKAREVINDDIVSITACSIDKLKKCYVFNGYEGMKKGMEKLRSKYKGYVYPYWHYSKKIGCIVPESCLDFERKKYSEEELALYN